MAEVRGPDPVDVAVGQRVRERRKALRISQTALGEAIGVTFQQVQKYELGTNRVSASRLTQISRVLQCSVAELHGEVGSGEDVALTPDVAELLAGYSQLSPPVQEALLHLAGLLGKKH